MRLGREKTYGVVQDVPHAAVADRASEETQVRDNGTFVPPAAPQEEQLTRAQ